MRPAMPKTLTCPVCGATFEKRRPNQKYCSQRCSNQHNKRVAKEYSLSRYDDAFSYAKPVTFEVLSKAKTKPANTSAVRWRMELRRRALAKRFGHKNLTFLPDPDIT